MFQFQFLAKLANYPYCKMVIYEITLPDDSTDKEWSVTSSEVSSEGEVLTIEDQLLANQARFARDFPYRSVGGPLKIVNIGRELYASSMTYKHIKPRWYMPGGYFHDSTLEAFITLCESRRGDDHMKNEKTWKAVEADAQVILYLTQFSNSHLNEKHFENWFRDTLNAIIRHFGLGSCATFSEALVGLGGAVAYTDPDTLLPDDRAAYLSKIDQGMFHKGKVFAGIEFKWHSLPRDIAWVRQQFAALPQTLCALAGRQSCAVGLFLCETGFRVIWRVQENAEDSEVPIFKYYTYPAVNPEQGWYGVRLCHTSVTSDGLGRNELLRVIYELAKASFVPAEVVTTIPVPEPPVVVAVVDEEQENNVQPGESVNVKKRGLSESSESAPQDNVYTATTYDFGVMSQSGEVEYYTGFALDLDHSESTTWLRE